MTKRSSAPARPVTAEPAPPPAGGLFDDLPPAPDDVDDMPQTGTAIVTAPPHTPALAHQIHALTLAGVSKVEEYLAARAKVGQTLLEVGIKATLPADWTLYKARGGGDDDVVAVLRDSGAVKVRRWLGIRIFNHRPELDPSSLGRPAPKIETEKIAVLDDKGKATGETREIRIATMFADGVSELTGEAAYGVMLGLRSEGEDGRQNFTGRGHLQDLMASCRTSLDTKVVRIISGLRKVPITELARLGLDTKKCVLGSGFGKSAERASKAVTTEGVLAAQQRLSDAITRAAGGDRDAFAGILKDITKYKGTDQKEHWARSVTDLNEEWKVEKAEKALAQHPMVKGS